MANDIDPRTTMTEDEKLAWVIRYPDPAAVIAAEAERNKIGGNANPEFRIAELREKVQAGVELTPEEQNLMNQWEKQQQPPPEPSATIPPPEQKTEKEQLDVLVKKMESGEQLTPEELALADKLTAPTPVAVPERIYRVGGQDIKESEIDGQISAKYGIELKTLKPEALQKLREDHITLANKEEWSRKYTQRDQGLAKSKRQVGDLSLRLLDIQERLNEQLAEVAQVKQRLQKWATMEMNSTDIYDAEGRLDPVKLTQFNRIMDAREQLPEIEQKEKSLQERSAQTERELVLQRFRDFQDEFPQYQTSQDVVTVAANLETGRNTEEDEHKLIEMVRIFREADQNKISPRLQYGYLKKSGWLTVKPTEQPSKAGNQPTYIKGEETKKTQELLAKLKERQSAAQILGSSGVPATPSSLTPQEQIAWRLRQLSSEALTGAKATTEQAIASLGY